MSVWELLCFSEGGENRVSVVLILSVSVVQEIRGECGSHIGCVRVRGEHW